ncbi:MAG: hypothetical protein NC933_02615, partial [Candidatus Omnitrophica bacterium]|nr:hypothetical protein [Candidatus Omnitrophota bacterium]
MKSFKLLSGLAIVAFLLLPAAEKAMAQYGANEGKKIASVSVENNRAISSEIILSKIKTKAGDSFKQDVLNDDLKRLYATEYFANITIDVED